MLRINFSEKVQTRSVKKKQEIWANAHESRESL